MDIARIWAAYATHVATHWSEFVTDFGTQLAWKRAEFAMAIAIVVAFLVYAKIPFLGPNDAKDVALLALSYVVITTPFVFSGITVAVALTRFPAHVGRLYAVDLIGAALGCVLLIVTIDPAPSSRTSTDTRPASTT